jgi:hypothetical protein
MAEVQVLQEQKPACAPAFILAYARLSNLAFLMS